MFFRNLLRVTYALLLLIVCMVVLFAGPMLNIAGVLPIGWALALLFVTVALTITTVITYGTKIVSILGRK